MLAVLISGGTHSKNSLNNTQHELSLDPSAQLSTSFFSSIVIFVLTLLVYIVLRPFLLLFKQVPLDDHLRFHLVVFFALFLRPIPDHQNELFFCSLGEFWRRQRWQWRLDSLVVLAQKVFVDEVCSVFTATLVPDVERKSELEVEGADLTDVFFLAAGLANAGSFENSLVSLPLKNGEGTETDSALLSEMLFQHS